MHRLHRLCANPCLWVNKNHLSSWTSSKDAVWRNLKQHKMICRLFLHVQIFTTTASWCEILLNIQNNKNLLRSIFWIGLIIITIYVVPIIQFLKEIWRQMGFEIKSCMLNQRISWGILSKTSSMLVIIHCEIMSVNLIFSPVSSSCSRSCQPFCTRNSLFELQVHPNSNIKYCCNKRHKTPINTDCDHHENRQHPSEIQWRSIRKTWKTWNIFNNTFRK